MATRLARVIRAADLASARPIVEPTTSEPERPRVTRMAREELQARERAERILREAHARAREIVARADEEARDALTRARLDAAAEHEATLAARWLALTKSQAAAMQREVDRMVVVGVALAERLLGTALALDPSRVVDLARTVLDEAGGARRVVLYANPVDAEALSAHLKDSGFEPCTAEIREDPTLGRGDLRLQTDIGNIDAQLSPRLERLASALRSTASRT